LRERRKNDAVRPLKQVAALGRIKAPIVGGARAGVEMLTALELNPTARLDESHELLGMRLSR
jgi:hypothetical protein